MSNSNKERRTLLKGVAVTGAIASIPFSASAALKRVVDGIEPSGYPTPNFESVKGELVNLKTQSGVSYKAKIAEVSELSFHCQTHKRPAHLRSCTTVVRFEVANAAELESDLYQLSHSTLGKMDLLMTMVPNIKGQMALEAVFN